MSDRKLLAAGVTGSVVAALCCGTSVLALVFGALGVSAWLAYADDVVLPALIVFLTITGYALWRRRVRERQRQ